MTLALIFFTSRLPVTSLTTSLCGARSLAPYSTPSGRPQVFTTVPHPPPLVRKRLLKLVHEPLSAVTDVKEARTESTILADNQPPVLPIGVPSATPCEPYRRESCYAHRV